MVYRSASYYTIRLGDFNRLAIEGTEQDIPVKRVIRHPDYNKPTSLNNDIALIQLSRPALLNSKVDIVCLPSPGEIVPSQASCFITGFNRISNFLTNKTPRNFFSVILDDRVFYYN